MLKTAIVLILLALAATPAAQAQTTSPSPGASAPSHAAATGSQGLANDQFTTEAAAKAHCPGETIVWANLGSSKAYHLSGDRYYGKTKHGAYMCQKDADRAGFHAGGRRRAKAAAKSTTAKTPE